MCSELLLLTSICCAGNGPYYYIYIQLVLYHRRLYLCNQYIQYIIVTSNTLIQDISALGLISLSNQSVSSYLKITLTIVIITITHFQTYTYILIITIIVIKPYFSHPTPQIMSYTQQAQPTIQQLSCSVCMSLFKTPITVQCGHTFCRYCLLNYVRSKQMCPICRTTLTHVIENHMQDFVVVELVQWIKKAVEAQHLAENRVKSKQSNQQGNLKLDHVENLILIDIRTRDLLLPYTKVKATFQLQSPTLIGKLQRFVARQQTPFNKYGIISKITNLNQLRYNVYECWIQGKNFCEIANEDIQRQSDQTEQYFYRVCQAKVIYQDDDQINPQILDIFYTKFKQIKDKTLLKNIYKYISPQHILNRNNKTATYYSIIRIIAQQNQKKYSAVTTFNIEQRQLLLRNFMEKVPENINNYPNKFVTTNQDSGILRGIAIAVFVFFVVLFLVLVNKDDAQL